MAYIAVLQVVLVLGLETGCFRFANKEGVDAKKVYSNAFVTVFCISATFLALMIAFAGGTSIGVNAMLSRKLGQGDKSGATRVAVTGIVLAFITSMVFSVLGGLFSHRIFGFFTTDADIIKMAESVEPIEEE